jgi:hypothetical protein
MLWFWLLVMFLAPIAGCLTAVMVASAPNVLTAAAGAFIGVGVALVALFTFH